MNKKFKNVGMRLSLHHGKMDGIRLWKQTNGNSRNGSFEYHCNWPYHHCERSAAGIYQKIFINRAGIRFCGRRT